MNTDSKQNCVALTMSIGEAAQLLGVSQSLLYKLARDGKFPAARLGNRWLVPRSRLDTFLEGDWRDESIDDSSDSH